ncbi:SET and MYND domain containing, arthropod-specific, member 5 isoform X2 [Colletes latitarsis]|uniref:SET and MYND domain containing, arthropod-specific, member 5 isoform X2 n=1 Tax=Colletes latitarsis TaxID=2605962 RepID=UPI0040362133
MSSETETTCPVCGVHWNAIFKCSGCKQQGYCSKDHQRRDWPRHKLICKAWEIHESPELGRHLLASRDLNPGDSIISESPLVWGPNIHTFQTVCVGCGKQCSFDYTCLMCLWPACQINCPGLTDKNRHGLECPFLMKVDIASRCKVLLIIRMLVLWRKKSKHWTTLEQFQSHEESRGPGTTAYKETQEVIKYIEPLLSGMEGAREMVGKICGLIDVNSLESMPEGSVAIYKTACLLEHSCLCNTKHSFTINDKGAPRITVTALCFIKKGEHLSTMYTHALWATMPRRAHLWETKYFFCHCKRCADPTEFGTYLGSLRCPLDNGYFLSKDPLNLKSEWACNTCHETLTALDIVEINKRLEDDIETIMNSRTKNEVVDFLSRLGEILSPSNQHCISLSHALIQVLSPKNPKKPELCKRIIKVTEILDPYGARLALYTATALWKLSKCPGEDEKSLLLKAISLLQYEPRNSPDI